jgi:hypothetical protein
MYCRNLEAFMPMNDVHVVMYTCMQFFADNSCPTSKLFRIRKLSRNRYRVSRKTHTTKYLLSPLLQFRTDRNPGTFFPSCRTSSLILTASVVRRGVSIPLSSSRP